MDKIFGVFIEDLFICSGMFICCFILDCVYKVRFSSEIICRVFSGLVS